MSESYVRPLVADPRKGVADIAVYPRPGAEPHRIGYLRSEKPATRWFCVTCGNTRCRWIKAAREHPDTSDMEGI
jgi:hypothetical protein